MTDTLNDFRDWLERERHSNSDRHTDCVYLEAVAQACSRRNYELDSAIRLVEEFLEETERSRPR